MSALTDLFDLVEKGVVLVFPTEESARSFSVRYVQERRKGIKASSVIAFDTFSSLFFPRLDNLEEVSEIDRLLFSEYAALNLYDKFHYFSSSYPEVQDRLSGFIKMMLRSLSDAALLKLRNRNAGGDLHLIMHEYTAFLSALNLYESSFEAPVIPELEHEYALIMPSAFPKEERIVEALKGHDKVKIIDDLTFSLPTLSKYTNEKEEIRALFHSIRALLDNGVTFSDIVISTSADERLRYYLESESYRFDIPLSFVSGRSPLSSASGAFLSSLSEIYTSNYSIASLKSFFLNPSIPFKNKDELLSFIEVSIANSITSAPSIDTDRYLRIPSKDGGDNYRTLRFTLDKLMSEKDPSKLLGLIHALMAGLLVDEEFSENEEDRYVYSFAMNELSAFVRSVRNAKAKGFEIDKPLFPIFIKYLEKTRYVSREKKEGIRVYPFTEDAALPVRYRFIIALNDEESIRKTKKAQFLSDYEIEGERREEDITRNILSCYAAFSDNLFLSASSETYKGFSLPLSALSAENAESGMDSWKEESVLGEVERIYPLQRAGYRAALASSLRERPYDEDFTYGHLGKPLAPPLSLSFSSFDAYKKCQYVYALKYRFGLNNILLMESSMLDVAERGTKLHKVLERYYKEGGGDPDTVIPHLFDEEMENWKNGVGLSSFEQRATDLIVENTRAVYLDNLITIVHEMDKISSTAEDGLERWLEHSVDDIGVILKGKIDRLGVSEDGEYLIFDYKSGKKFSKNDLSTMRYQMFFYKLLAEGECNGSVSKAYFISLRDGKLTDVDLSVSDEEVLDQLKIVAEGMEKGDWRAISNDQNCQGCAYRGVCRRRFAVR